MLVFLPGLFEIAKLCDQLKASEKLRTLQIDVLALHLSGIDRKFSENGFDKSKRIAGKKRVGT